MRLVKWVLVLTGLDLLALGTWPQVTAGLIVLAGWVTVMIRYPKPTRPVVLDHQGHEVIRSGG